MKIITLTTDFGWADGYVGAMKGVILSIAPRATIVDICHDIAPQNVKEAAFVLHTVHRYFPADAIHLIVVDPEVGSARRAIALRTDRACFVAPDNGVLSYILAEDRVEQAVSLTRACYWRPEISRTFHGRDIFAPVAAHLAQGVPLEDLGQPVERRELLTFPTPRPSLRPDNTVVGHIIHVDRFGNLITDLQEDESQRFGLSLDEGIVVEVGGQQIEGVRSTYTAGEAGKPLALIGSAGRLEIAVPGGSAALRLRVTAGDEVLLYERLAPGGSHEPE